MESNMSSAITNEVLATKIDGLSNGLVEVKTAIQGFSGSYVSHEVFELRFRELDLANKQLAIKQVAIDVEIEKLKNKRIVPQIVTAFIASIITAAFTYLLYARIQG